MKDTKRKALIKAAKKEAKKNIHNSLIAELEKAVGSIGTVSAKLKKVIAKSSEKLAKKITKEIQLDKAIIAANAAPVNAEKSSPAKTAPVKVKSPAKKTETKVAKAETVVTAS
ncbi:MAG: hypothetical protein ABIN91_17860 [Mucilaginibacter sp.]|uniref:hypothetical protein n=1 Tax=Mucilaginibacter sp. TaxID=1882438 RepID=UPI0032666010